MSFGNPTSLQLGMTGKLEGKTYRLVGRSVLGEVENGETYYWNEFNLETSAGESATLVFDETESNSHWRLFTQFDAEYPMTAADAAAKRVGDHLNLTGEDVRVTFRGSSKVQYVEGQAPEGENVGSTAEYFNAESGSIMQVVSWTGDEVEFYWGMDLTYGQVARAFGLPQKLVTPGGQAFSALDDSDSDRSDRLKQYGLWTAIVLVAVFMIFALTHSFHRNREGNPVVQVPAPSRPLEIGATGALFGKQYRVTGHLVVDIAEVGAHWDRHEYKLTDEAGAMALLVCGDRPFGAGDWICYDPLAPLIPLNPKEAAAKKVGDPVEVDGFNGKVTGISLSTIRQVEGEGFEEWQVGQVFYGLSGVNEYRQLLARWNESGIRYFSGRALPDKKALK
jgi:hypothetical protein